MRKKVLAAAACTALMIAGAMYGVNSQADAGGVAARSVPPGFGIVYTAGTVQNYDGNQYTIVMTFLRLPGETDWSPGIIHLWGPNGQTEILEYAVNEDPFVVEFSSHNTAFINSNTTYKGQPARLSVSLQEWESNPGLNRLMLVAFPDSGAPLILSGTVQGVVDVQP